MEILIRVVDKEGAHASNAGRGDAISIQPDGWLWSTLELTEHFWRIIRVPLLQIEADALMGGPITEQQKIATGNRMRDYRVDFDLLPNPSDFTGLRTKDIIPLTKKQVAVAIIKK